MTRQPDVTIVGGGPAGSSLAIALGRAGARVVLYEKATFPRLKPCGEGLLPHGVAALERLIGVPDAPRVRGLRFSAGGETVDVDFPAGTGLVVRRDRLDTWLFTQARETAGVDVRVGTEFCGERGRVLVGADGTRSRFHRLLPAIPDRPRRVGLSTHVRGIAGVKDRVEVFFHDHGEIYVAPAGDGETLVAGLFDYRHFRRDGLRHLLGTLPGLRDRVEGFEQTTPMLASAPLGLRVPRIVDHERQLLLAGDAAGCPDPITGDGMALALSSTELAAAAILTGRLGQYQSRRLARGRRARRLGRLMLWLSRTERRAAWFLRDFSGVVPLLLEVALEPGADPLRAK
ncbi:MAG: hypothetical protein CL483_00095 [Acidobacteria bacterium]|nr:hypothetical protein [Acidobacteriota bacterium]